MTENIVIDFSANTQGLTASIDLLEKLGQVDAKTAQQFREATNAYKKQEEAIKADTEAAKQLGNEHEKAATKGKKAASETTNEFEKLGKSIKGIAATIGVAFGVAEVIRFGKESVKAFAEAEVNARLLQTAVGVNGGLQKDFEKLIEQSSDLQKITIFSDDDIQKAQTVALQFGLTAQQVQGLIPVAADFASGAGKSLGDAMNIILDGVRGNGRALKDYRIEVDSAGSKSENLANITTNLNKLFEGQAQVVGTTVFGATEKLKNKFGEFQETVGEVIVDAGEATSALILWVANGFKPLDDELDANAGKLGKTTAAIEKFQKATDGLALAGLQSQLELLTKADAPADALRRVNEQIKALNLSVFNKEIDALDDKELVKKLKDIEAQSKQTSYAIVKQSDLSLKEQLKIINEEIEARKAAGKLKDELDKKDGDPNAAKKALDEKMRLLKEEADRRKALSDFTFDAEEQNLQKFLADEKEKLVAQNLSAEDLDKALTELELEELNKRRDNYLLFGKDVSAIDGRIADLHIKQQQKTTKDEQTELDKREKQFEKLNENLAKADANLRNDQDKIAEEDARKRKARQELILQEASQLANDLRAIVQIGIDEEIQLLEDKRDAIEKNNDAENELNDQKLKRGVISQGKHDKDQQNLAKKHKVEQDKLNAEIKEQKRKQAEADRQLAIFGIILGTAQTIIQTGATLGYPAAIPFVAIAAALGAVELATVLSQPLPKFAKGVERLGGKGTGTSDSNLAWLSAGERVVDAKTNTDYYPTLSAIHNHKINPKLINEFVMRKDIVSHGTATPHFAIDYGKLASELAYEIKTNQRTSFNISNVDEFAKALQFRNNPRRPN